MNELPVIDIGPLRSGKNREKTAAAIRSACIDRGFFYIVDHGVDPKLEKNLEKLSQQFFARPEAEKLAISMDKGGRAWRGYFPLGGELTSGKPDWKEGLYFGEELADTHPLVIKKTPLHGRNLFPELQGFREVVLAYMQAMQSLSQTVMEGIALSLGLSDKYFYEHFTHDPTLLFRIFHYPPPPEAMREQVWGVGEHTDYGLLTILKQDQIGGLEVKDKAGWVKAPPLPGAYVCNIGDMLDRLTKGLYRSTPHRVRNISGKERYSFPFFFDPGFDSVLRSLPLDSALFAQEIDRAERWDKADVHAAMGTYGEYLLKKVGKVFPDLDSKVLT